MRSGELGGPIFSADRPVGHGVVPTARFKANGYLCLGDQAVRSGVWLSVSQLVRGKRLYMAGLLIRRLDANDWTFTVDDSGLVLCSGGRAEALLFGESVSERLAEQIAAVPAARCWWYRQNLAPAPSDFGADVELQELLP